MCELERSELDKNLNSELHSYGQKIRSERDAEFVSKVNKSVVTVRSGHFMNSVCVSPGIYSCAVDAFLEISTDLFFHINLSNLRSRYEFTDLLFNVCSHYISSREDSSLLREIS